ncbi:MAG: GNAT family N-acetyltransferase [bacterium]|nr:GNAT family N-acetyltransferase [bacterium]
MTTIDPQIRSARPSETSETVACIVAAFIADPLCRFAWPSPHQYLEGMPRAAEAFGGASVAEGTTDVADAFHGAGLWMAPGVHPDGEALEQAFRETAQAEHLDALLETFEQMDRWHPEEDHWYLPLIGVEPNAQGRGIGAALMRHATERADADGLPCYLESSNPRNISLYERHGFERMGEIRVGAGPLVTPMWRPAR